MKISARNNIQGTIKRLHLGPINASVLLEVAPGVEITSVITREAADSLGLQEGETAYAVIKASSVMIGVD